MKLETVLLDKVQRFSFDELDARGCYVYLNKACESVQATHHYPAKLAKLLNQFALSSVLLHDSIKLDGSLTIQYRTSGAISLLIADCVDLENGERGVRAICEFDPQKFPNQIGDVDLRMFGADATLAITMTPTEGKRYQGIVPIESASLESCLEDYFLRSEQLPTRFKLYASDDEAVGLSLHALPEQDQEMVADMKDDWNRLCMLLDTVTKEEMLTLDAESILTRLFHEEQCRIQPANDVKFYCECSRERSENAIKSLGAEEINSLISEQEVVTIDCHFCFQRYEFDHEQLRALAKELQSQ